MHARGVSAPPTLQHPPGQRRPAARAAPPCAPPGQPCSRAAAAPPAWCNVAWCGAVWRQRPAPANAETIRKQMLQHTLCPAASVQRLGGQWWCCCPLTSSPSSPGVAGGRGGPASCTAPEASASASMVWGGGRAQGRAGDAQFATASLVARQRCCTHMHTPMSPQRPWRTWNDAYAPASAVARGPAPAAATAALPNEAANTSRRWAGGARSGSAAMPARKRSPQQRLGTHTSSAKGLGAAVAAAAVVIAAPGVRSRWEGGAGRREAAGAGGAASTLRRLNWKATPPACPSATSCAGVAAAGGGGGVGDVRAWRGCSTAKCRHPCRAPRPAVERRRPPALPPPAHRRWC